MEIVQAYIPDIPQLKTAVVPTVSTEAALPEADWFTRNIFWFITVIFVVMSTIAISVAITSKPKNKKEKLVNNHKEEDDTE